MTYARNMSLNTWLQGAARPMIKADIEGQLVIEVLVNGEFRFTGYRENKRISNPDNKKDLPVVLQCHFDVDDLLQALDEILVFGVLYRIEMDEVNLKFIVRSATGVVSCRWVRRTRMKTYERSLKVRPNMEQIRLAALHMAGPNWIACV